MGLSFEIAAAPRQHSHSQVRVPRDSLPHFTVSDSRLPQPVGQGPRIYIPQALGSFFVASYDSQGYGGGIRPRLHSPEGSHLCESLRPKIGNYYFCRFSGFWQ
jgi:hypothetical protein